MSLLVLFAMGCTNTNAESSMRRQSLNSDWKFTKGDPAGTGDKLAYPNIKKWLLPTANDFNQTARFDHPADNLGGDVEYTHADFDDSGWRSLNLPHDWGIEGPFNQEYPGETGKLPWWGVAWYRKHFKLGPDDAGKQISLEIDGAMAYATVWINGQCAGGWPYGYASWRVDLTQHVKPGDNVIAIRLDNPPDSSRWYPGGGIYRNVWLTKTAPIHVGHWGTYITTPNVSKDAATINVATTIDNDSAKDDSAKFTTSIYDTDKDGNRTGGAIASLEISGVEIGGGKSITNQSKIEIKNPNLWSVDNPHLYLAVTTLAQAGKTIDTYETHFGIRTIQFTANDGFHLNGERLKIQGICDHHDLGALGSALSYRALQRQLEILKSMGCNAIRTSHNPPAPELLDLADRMGFVVMDEGFDCWEHQKKPNDYHKLFDDWHEMDFRAQIRRDRNHPCVVLWSIGNEIYEQGVPAKHYLGKQLTDIAHQEDATRPTVSACNQDHSGYNGFNKIMDVFGDNYDKNDYIRFRNANPDQPVIGSETASCVSTRGEYFFPVTQDKMEGRSNFQVSSYDYYAPRWAMPPDWEFKAQDEAPYCVGEFVWTGFDYLGEPTPFNGDSTNLLNFTDPAEQAKVAEELKELGKIKVPSRSSYFGIIDLAGFPKDRYYIYQAHWRPDFPMAHILPHWNWPERIGEVTPVHVYSSGDEAELFLNGKSLGKKTRGKYQYRFHWDDVVYEPGELHVVTWKNGKKWAEDTVKTTGDAAKVTLKPDRPTIHADGEDLSFVTVTIADKDGQMVPRTHNLVKFQIEGPGEIAAVDNGDPTSFEPFQASQRKAFNGLALVIVRSKPGQSGQITLKATADGLEGSQASITTK
jgi:beta-galactosidase